MSGFAAGPETRILEKRGACRRERRELKLAESTDGRAGLFGLLDGAPSKSAPRHKKLIGTRTIGCKSQQP